MVFPTVTPTVTQRDSGGQDRSIAIASGSKIEITNSQGTDGFGDLKINLGKS